MRWGTLCGAWAISCFSIAAAAAQSTGNGALASRETNSLELGPPRQFFEISVESSRSNVPVMPATPVMPTKPRDWNEALSTVSSLPIITVAGWDDLGGTGERPTRRAVIRLLAPVDDTTSARVASLPADEPTAPPTTLTPPANPSQSAPSTTPKPATPAASSNSNRPRVSMRLEPVPERLEPAAAAVAADESESPALLGGSADLATSPETATDESEASAELASPSNSTPALIEKTDPFLLEILPIEAAAISEIPAFRVALTHRGERLSGTARATLKLSESSAVKRFVPADAWKFDPTSKLWTLEIDLWEPGEKQVWKVELEPGISRCLVEAKVAAWDTGSSSIELPSRSEEAASADSNNSPADEPQVVSPAPRNSPTAPSENAVSQSIRDQRSEAPAAPAPQTRTPANASEPRRLSPADDSADSDDSQELQPGSDSMEDDESEPGRLDLESAAEDEVIAEDSAEEADASDDSISSESSVATIRCEGPSRTRPGTSVILALSIANTSDQPLIDVELETEFPSGVFLEGRRHVLVGDAIAPGKTRTLEVAVRAHEVGEHTLDFIVIQDGKTLAKVQHLLTVEEGSLQVRLDGPERFTMGAEETFAVELQHNGTEPLDDLVVTLALAEGLRVTTVEHEAGYDRDRNLLAWRIVRLEPGDQVLLRYKLKAEKSGSARQAVEVTCADLEKTLDAELAMQIISTSTSERMAADPMARPRQPAAPTPTQRTPDPNGRVPLTDPPYLRR